MPIELGVVDELLLPPNLAGGAGIARP